MARAVSGVIVGITVITPVGEYVYWRRCMDGCARFYYTIYDGCSTSFMWCRRLRVERRYHVSCGPAGQIAPVEP